MHSRKSFTEENAGSLKQYFEDKLESEITTRKAKRHFRKTRVKVDGIHSYSEDNSVKCEQTLAVSFDGRNDDVAKVSGFSESYVIPEGLNTRNSIKRNQVDCLCGMNGTFVGEETPTLACKACYSTLALQESLQKFVYEKMSQIKQTNPLLGSKKYKTFVTCEIKFNAVPLYDDFEELSEGEMPSNDFDQDDREDKGKEPEILAKDSYDFRKEETMPTHIFFSSEECDTQNDLTEFELNLSADEDDHDQVYTETKTIAIKDRDIPAKFSINSIWKDIKMGLDKEDPVDITEDFSIVSRKGNSEDKDHQRPLWTTLESLGRRNRKRKSRQDSERFKPLIVRRKVSYKDKTHEPACPSIHKRSLENFKSVSKGDKMRKKKRNARKSQK